MSHKATLTLTLQPVSGQMATGEIRRFEHVVHIPHDLTREKIADAVDHAVAEIHKKVAAASPAIPTQPMTLADPKAAASPTKGPGPVPMGEGKQALATKLTDEGVLNTTGADPDRRR